MSYPPQRETWLTVSMPTIGTRLDPAFMQMQHVVMESPSLLTSVLPPSANRFIILRRYCPTCQKTLTIWLTECLGFSQIGWRGCGETYIFRSIEVSPAIAVHVTGSRKTVPIRRTSFALEDLGSVQDLRCLGTPIKSLTKVSSWLKDVYAFI